MKLEKTLRSKTKIRFQDCDPFNHLNNSRYLDYYMNAREDQLKDNYDLDIFDIARTERIGWVVTSNQLAYFSSANTMETVCIHSSLIQFSEKSLLVEMTMWDETETKLKSLLWAKFVHVDLKTQTAIPHSEKLSGLFQAIVDPRELISFEERSRQIKMEYTR